MVPFDGFFTGLGRAVNGLDVFYTVTLDHFYICDSLPTVFKRCVDGLEINVKTITIFINSMTFVHIVVAEYLLFELILQGDSTVW